MLGASADADLVRFEEAAPTDVVSALRYDPKTKRRELVPLRWGLVPRWAKKEMTLFNARAETLLDKPSFRLPFTRQRCLVPADGFFEWPTVEGRKQKTLIRRADLAPFVFAGLWDAWKPPSRDKKIESVAIITCAPNAFMQPIHERMPVILAREDFETWLDPEADCAELARTLLAPRPWDGMETA